MVNSRSESTVRLPAGRESRNLDPRFGSTLRSAVRSVPNGSPRAAGMTGVAWIPDIFLAASENSGMTRRKINSPWD
ncbi:hypothetical protein HY504_02770 [Candidatus Wolfebacteria bacterium]|nr:hypothetical protein [Candidatus Wolfebacteria bacterium]